MPNTLVKRITVFLLPLILAMLLIGRLSPPACAQTKPQVDLTGKNVLVLHGLESNVPIFQLTDRGLRAALDAGGVTLRIAFKEGMETDKGREKDVVTPADLSVLPVEWLQRFSRALRRGRSDELLNMIDGIRPEHGGLARALAGLIRIYRFDKLVAVTGEALKENSNA